MERNDYLFFGMMAYMTVVFCLYLGTEYSGLSTMVPLIAGIPLAIYLSPAMYTLIFSTTGGRNSRTGRIRKAKHVEPFFDIGSYYCTRIFWKSIVLAIIGGVLSLLAMRFESTLGVGTEVIYKISLYLLVFMCFNILVSLGAKKESREAFAARREAEYVPKEERALYGVTLTKVFYFAIPIMHFASLIIFKDLNIPGEDGFGNPTEGTAFSSLIAIIFAYVFSWGLIHIISILVVIFGKSEEKEGIKVATMIGMGLFIAAFQFILLFVSFISASNTAYDPYFIFVFATFILLNLNRINIMILFRKGNVFPAKFVILDVLAIMFIMYYPTFIATV